MHNKRASMDTVSCRLCLSREGPFISLLGSEEIEADAITLIMKVTMCTSVLITRTDLISKIICETCHSFVHQWFSFKEQCLLNDKKLKDSLEIKDLEQLTSESTEDSSLVADLLNDTIIGFNGNSSDSDAELDKYLVTKVKEICNDNEKKSNRRVKVKNKTLNRRAPKTSQLERRAKFHTKQTKCKNQNSQQRCYPQCCGKTFITKISFRMHVDAFHRREKHFACDECGKKGFISETTLRRHKLLHSNKFACKICGKAFTCHAILRIHERDKHEGDHPYVCDVCGKAFVTELLLGYHQRFHTGEKKYVCDICGSAFVTSSGLSKHKRTHSNVKPHVCDVCAKGFIVRSRLIEHIRVHTGERPFVCDVCDKSFTMHDKLKRHKKTHNVSAVG